LSRYSFSITPRVLIRTIVILVLGLAASCENAPPAELSGYLYFGSGNYLVQLSLRNGSTAIAGKLAEVDIRDIKRYGDVSLLLTVVGPVNRKETWRLLRFDLDAGHAATLFDSHGGLYLPGPETLLYDDGVRLRATFWDGDDPEIVVVGRHAVNAWMHLIAVSPSAAIFGTGDGPIEKYDFADRSLTTLAALSRVCGLKHAIWITDRRRLLCRLRPATGEPPGYALVGLDGEIDTRLSLPDGGPFSAVAYLPDNDAAVFTERWTSLISNREKTAVWIYDFSLGKAWRLLEDQHLGDSAVFSRL